MLCFFNCKQIQSMYITLCISDVNECEDPQISELCEFGCENTVGSYRCVDGEKTNATPTYSIDLSPIKTCGQGFRMDAFNMSCVDIDECNEQNTGCEFCKNLIGGYECTCPEGFQLTDSNSCQV